MTKKQINNILLIIAILFVISLLCDIYLRLGIFITPLFFAALFIWPFFIGIYKMILPKNDGFTFWINPILKLTSELVKVDGRVLLKEKKRVKLYLLDEFEGFTARRKMRYFEKYLNKEFEINPILKEINESYENKEKIQVLNFLIGVAICDQLLSKSEEKFIDNIAKKMSISGLTLKSIYALHNYVTEEDLNHKKTYSPSNYKKSRAFTILGLEKTATQEEIKKSYRELVKIYHPDKLGKKVYSKAALERAKIRFQEVKDAYELLNK